jgi:hypothetical protein
MSLNFCCEKRFEKLRYVCNRIVELEKIFGVIWRKFFVCEKFTLGDSKELFFQSAVKVFVPLYSIKISNKKIFTKKTKN